MSSTHPLCWGDESDEDAGDFGDNGCEDGKDETGIVEIYCILFSDERPDDEGKG